MTQSSLISRNIIAASGRLKLEFWAALQDICRREQVSSPRWSSGLKA